MGVLSSVTPEVTGWLNSANADVAYVSVFTLLFLGGIGFPIPEDIPLLLAGVAIEKKLVDFRIMYAICYVGVLIGDQIMYLIGYKFGNRLLDAGQRSPFFPTITEEKINEVRDGLRRRRLLYIFIGRHLFPVRSVTFIAAGALRIPFLEFLATDMLAALVSVTLIVGLGYFLGQRLTPEHIEYLAHEMNTIILIVVLVALAGFLAQRYFRKRRRAKKPGA